MGGLASHIEIFMKKEILGIKIDSLNEIEVLKKIEDFLSDSQQHYIVSPNPEFLVEAQKDAEFRNILNQADLAIPDGVGLVYASWFLGQPVRKRLAGVDLMEMICCLASQKKWPVFLLGAKEGVAEKTAEKLIEKYPELQIESQNPKILFVALGAPKQEKWIADNLAKMTTVKLAMGVGGAFDFISGRTRRAPKLLRKAGLEWLWRFVLQPWRAKRIFRAIIIFPWLVIHNRLFSLLSRVRYNRGNN